MHRIIFIIWNIVLIASLCGCSKGKATLVTEDTGDVDVAVLETGTISTGSDVYPDDLVAVYVCGAVACPGVYYISGDSIKEEALEAAGGYADGAATTYVNLAEPVISGEQIYFPYEEELSANYSPVNKMEEDSDKVNINTATAEELMTLPGIGESKADSIIEYRETHGGFQCIEEITNIPGIKDGIYNNIKDYIVVD